MAISLFWSGAPERCFTMKTPASQTLDWKGQALLLLRKSLNYGRKKFCYIGSWSAADDPLMVTFINKMFVNITS